MTNGNPVVITFVNTSINGKDYETMQRVPRPGHADYLAYCKYGSARDVRGGGMFSRSMIAPLTAARALLRGFIGAFGIKVGA